MGSSLEGHDDEDMENFDKAVKLIIKDQHKTTVDDTIIDRFIESLNDDHTMLVDNEFFSFGLWEHFESDEFASTNQNALFRIAAASFPVPLHPIIFEKMEGNGFMGVIMWRSYVVIKDRNLSSMCGFIELLTRMCYAQPMYKNLLKGQLEPTKLEWSPIEIKDIPTMIHYFLNYKQGQHVVIEAKKLFRAFIIQPALDARGQLRPTKKIPLPVTTLLKLSVEKFSIHALVELRSILEDINSQKLPEFVKGYGLDSLLVSNLNKWLAEKDLSLEDLSVYCSLLAMVTPNTSGEDLILQELIEYNKIRPIVSYVVKKGDPKSAHYESIWYLYVLYPLLIGTDDTEDTQVMISKLLIANSERERLGETIDRSTILFILDQISQKMIHISNIKLRTLIQDCVSCYIKSHMDEFSCHRQVMECIRVLRSLGNTYNLSKKKMQKEFSYLFTALCDHAIKTTNDLILFQIFKILGLFIETRIILKKVTNVLTKNDKQEFSSLIFKNLDRAIETNDITLLEAVLELIALCVERSGFSLIEGKDRLSTLFMNKIWPLCQKNGQSSLISSCLSILTTIDTEKELVESFKLVQFGHIPRILGTYLCDITIDREMRDKIIGLIRQGNIILEIGYLRELIKKFQTKPRSPLDDATIDKILYGACLTVRLENSKEERPSAVVVIKDLVSLVCEQNSFEDSVNRLVRTNLITTLYELCLDKDLDPQYKKKFVELIDELDKKLFSDLKIDAKTKKAILIGSFDRYWDKSDTDGSKLEPAKQSDKNGGEEQRRLSVLKEILSDEETEGNAQQQVGDVEMSLEEPHDDQRLTVDFDSDILPEITLSKNTSKEDVADWYINKLKSSISEIKKSKPQKSGQIVKERSAWLDVLACERKRLDAPDTDCY